MTNLSEDLFLHLEIQFLLKNNHLLSRILRKKISRDFDQFFGFGSRKKRKFKTILHYIHQLSYRISNT